MDFPVCVFKAGVDDSLIGLAHQIKGSADHGTVTDVTISVDANNNDRFNSFISVNASKVVTVVTVSNDFLIRHWKRLT